MDNHPDVDAAARSKLTDVSTDLSARRTGMSFQRTACPLTVR